MADQIAIQLPATRIDERTNLPVTARFRTRSTGADSAPTTAHYKLFNMSTRDTIKEFTSLTAAADISFTLDARDLKIGDPTHEMERIALTVVADKGLSTQVTKEVRFQIRNVGGWDESTDA